MSDEHKRCIAIGCHLHRDCQLPFNYDARVKIWPPYLGKLCEHFVYKKEFDSDDD